MSEITKMFAKSKTETLEVLFIFHFKTPGYPFVSHTHLMCNCVMCNKMLVDNNGMEFLNKYHLGMKGYAFQFIYN